jgi:putative ABC transport system permease protein
MIGCINYMNLATARAVHRVREVGVRKTFGATLSQLIYKFLCESILFILIAFLIAIVSAAFLIPHLGKFVDSNLTVAYVWDASLFGAFPVLVILIGLIAGS